MSPREHELAGHLLACSWVVLGAGLLGLCPDTVAIFSSWGFSALALWVLT